MKTSVISAASAALIISQLLAPAALALTDTKASQKAAQAISTEPASQQLAGKFKRYHNPCRPRDIWCLLGGSFG